MKGLAITNEGIEDITASEIKELVNVQSEKRKSCVVFEAKKYEDFFRLCYRMQSARKIMLLLANFKIKSTADIKKQLDSIDISEWICRGTRFVVRSIILNSSLSSQEVEPETGEFILEKVSAKVDLKNPEATFFVFIDSDDCYLGIDFSGKDLGVRDYRIFTGAEKLKSTIAYSMLRIAGFGGGKCLLDPFCSSGTIPIEAALFASSFSVNFFSKDKFLFSRLSKFSDFNFAKFFESEDSAANEKSTASITAADRNFQAISAAKKNAKIAGIIKQVSFTRKDTEWLELKFKEHSVDLIVTFPPQESRMLPAEKAARIYDELFYQADFILKKDGAVALLLKSAATAEKSALKHNFAVKEKRSIMQGKEEFSAVVFSPKPL